MKIEFKYGVSAYTGKVDEIVIYYTKQSHHCITRRLPVRKPTEQNYSFRQVQVQLQSIKPSQAYKADLNAYREQFNITPRLNSKLLINWNNVYKMLLYDLQRRMPEQVNLATITRQQIYAEDLPCVSVAKAVQEGLLPQVTGWENLTAEI
jgi:hypothetical protein